MNFVALSCLVIVNSAISNKIIDKYGGTNSFRHLKTKIHLWAFLCVSTSTHPNIFNNSSVVALLCITSAALSCRRCKLLVRSIDSPPRTESA